MLIIVDSKFASLTHEQIDAVLRNPNPHGFDLEISDEINRLIVGYTTNFEALCERLGRVPERILAIKAQTPIEDAARSLFKTILAQEFESIRKP